MRSNFKKITLIMIQICLSHSYGCCIVSWTNLRHHAKFDTDRLNRLEIWLLFDFFSKWRPYAILNLFHASLDHPRREFGGLCHCAKFGLNQFSSFVNMRILIFCALGLKLPIHAHFLGRGVLGPLDP